MADRPNVLLICTEHWPALMTRAAGDDTLISPTLSQLARCGVWYDNAYSACPSCIPARRSLMTGLSPRTHGDRVFNEHLRMPEAPTLPQCFRDGGYQAYAVGKLHVYPQRSRIGFDDVLLNEEGRHHLGHGADDWELHLAERGHAGEEYAAGHCNNGYVVTPWHLPDDLHPTRWAAREMCRTIRRRDPDWPAFWYLSFVGVHPPTWPPRQYLELYDGVDMPDPVVGDWARDVDSQPWMLRDYNDGGSEMRDATPHEIALARKAFYAEMTHIDHQLRVVLGTLREQKLLDDTIIVFTADHGDMLGDHGRWAKTVMFEMSAGVPMLVVPPAGDDRLTPGTRDDRLVELRDVMPTLLDLAGLAIPDGVEGLSMIGDRRRDHLYGEHWEGDRANRMIRRGDFKLIYYAAGNRVQLFDVRTDPRETRDLGDDPAHAETRAALTKLLIDELYGSDRDWLRDGELVGLPEPPLVPRPPRSLAAQRGMRFL